MRYCQFWQYQNQSPTRQGTRSIGNVLPIITCSLYVVSPTCQGTRSIGNSPVTLTEADVLANPLLARGRDRLGTSCAFACPSARLILLLARGRDRLETTLPKLSDIPFGSDPLLARGRDRLETPFAIHQTIRLNRSPTRQGTRSIGNISQSTAINNSLKLPYSLGDAIDWKLSVSPNNALLKFVSYTLGDAIDWKPRLGCIYVRRFQIPYSLGDAIDWKQHTNYENAVPILCLLLARGRDRLETSLEAY